MSQVRPILHQVQLHYVPVSPTTINLIPSPGSLGQGPSLLWEQQHVPLLSCHPKVPWTQSFFTYLWWPSDQENDQEFVSACSAVSPQSLRSETTTCPTSLIFPHLDGSCGWFAWPFLLCSPNLLVCIRCPRLGGQQRLLCFICSCAWLAFCRLVV